MEKVDVYGLLREKIIKQQLAPGQVLNERDLMETYKIGRTPLRDVLMDLQRDGLVNVIPRYGTFVAPLKMEEFRYIMEVRIYLEEVVGKILCDRIMKSHLDEMRALLDKANQLLDKDERVQTEIQELLDLETRFHYLTYDATGNPYLVDIMHRLQASSTRFWFYTVMDLEKMRQQFADLEGIYDALVRRNKTECCKLLRRHIEEFIEHIRLYFVPLHNTEPL